MLVKCGDVDMLVRSSDVDVSILCFSGGVVFFSGHYRP